MCQNSQNFTTLCPRILSYVAPSNAVDFAWVSILQYAKSAVTNTLLGRKDTTLTYQDLGTKKGSC